MYAMRTCNAFSKTFVRPLFAHFVSIAACLDFEHKERQEPKDKSHCDNWDSSQEDIGDPIFRAGKSNAAKCNPTGRQKPQAFRPFEVCQGWGESECRHARDQQPAQPSPSNATSESPGEIKRRPSE